MTKREFLSGHFESLLGVFIQLESNKMSEERDCMYKRIRVNKDRRDAYSLTNKINSPKLLKRPKLLRPFEQFGTFCIKIKKGTQMRVP